MTLVDLDLENLSTIDVKSIGTDISVGLAHDRCVTMTAENYNSKIFR